MILAGKLDSRRHSTTSSKWREQVIKCKKFNHFATGKEQNRGADLGGGSRGCAPPPPEMTCGFLNTTGILQKKKKNYVVYWC